MTQSVAVDLVRQDSSSDVDEIVVVSSDLKCDCGGLLRAYRDQAVAVLKKSNVLDTRQSMPRIKVATDMTTDNRRSQPQADAAQFDSASEEFDYEKKSQIYVPVDPQYTFERVILSDRITERILEAVGILECEAKVFEEWGLIEIQPHPSTALGFFGPSGTGKTMAAEAIAHKLGRKILKVSYADVESKYHGEGPKMVKAIFLAAKRENAILFFDEADSLLSKRLTNVTQGSEQAINSMRSQLLICLEDFHGIVIFATNLVANYDKAFLTRIVSVEFQIPDVEARKKIWEGHLRAPQDGREHKLNIPLASDVDTAELAETYEFVGREIRNAVVSACVSVALDKRQTVEQDDLTRACEKIQDEKRAVEASQKERERGQDVLRTALVEKIREQKGKNAVDGLDAAGDMAVAASSRADNQVMQP